MIELDENFKQFFNLLNIHNKTFDFFDIISPKEVLVSEWLAFLLNPSINGVGNLTIQKLLDSVQIDKNIEEYSFISTNTEVSTDKNQRMDIVIKYDRLWIVIENKIESLENGNQTEEYYNYIESTKEDNEVIYIYLKPNYNSSVPKEKEFIILTYNQLINKLKEISEFDYKEKEKYKYLKEFILSGGRFMNNEEFEVSDSLLFYINNIEKFESIQQEYKTSNRNMLTMISNRIVDALNENIEKYQYTKNTNTFIQFYKENWNNKNHQGIHFEWYFTTNNVIGKEMDSIVVLHIESNITEEEKERLKEFGITTQSTTACYHDIPVKESIHLSFTTPENIK